MEAKDFPIRKTPCSSPLPELEVPMITTMVTCLGSEHRKLDQLNVQLAFAATTLASDPDALAAINGLSRRGTRYGAIYGRISKSKTGWCSRGPRRITQFQVHCSIL